MPTYLNIDGAADLAALSHYTIAHIARVTGYANPMSAMTSGDLKPFVVVVDQFGNFMRIAEAR